MGIRAWYDVWCDAKGCTAWTHGGNTLTAAARVAQKDGWRRRSEGGWVCPEHRDDVCGRPRNDEFCGLQPMHSGEHWRVLA